MQQACNLIFVYEKDIKVTKFNMFYSEMYYTVRSNTRTNKKIQIDLSTVHWASGLTKTKKNHCVSNLILAGNVYFIPCLEIVWR